MIIFITFFVSTFTEQDQFHDGGKLRAKEKETILWEAVGKSGGTSADIIMVAPAIVASIFEELGKDSDSKGYSKELVQKK